MTTENQPDPRIAALKEAGHDAAAKFLEELPSAEPPPPITPPGETNPEGIEVNNNPGQQLLDEIERQVGWQSIPFFKEQS